MFYKLSIHIIKQSPLREVGVMVEEKKRQKKKETNTTTCTEQVSLETGHKKKKTINIYK
jgi:hypothetical protein